MPLLRINLRQQRQPKSRRLPRPRLRLRAKIPPFFSKKGIALSCTSVGVLMPSSSSPLTRSAGNPSSLNVLKIYFVLNPPPPCYPKPKMTSHITFVKKHTLKHPTPPLA